MALVPFSKPVPIPYTQAGYQKLQSQAKGLEQDRAAVLVRLQLAREMGDLSENGAYKSAKQELGRIDRELRQVKFLLANAQITPPTRGNQAGFGSIVTLTSPRHSLTFTLVSQYEADPKRQFISLNSPFGVAVAGKKQGDTISVVAPAGITNYTLTQVK